jgi:hypothetical protein
MTRGGETRLLSDNIDGVPLGKVNFVLRDSRNGIRLRETVVRRVMISVLAAMPGSAATAQDSEKALVERACTTCHTLTSALKQRNSRYG